MALIKRADGLVQVLKDDNLVCDHCGEYVEWSRFFDSYYCTDCRTDDVHEKEEEDTEEPEINQGRN